MDFPNIFTTEVVDHIKSRIYELAADTKPLWGKMNAAQMLAHLNVTYELIYENAHPKPNFFKRLLVKLIAKSTVVGNKPYPKNLRTAPIFLVASHQDFQREQQRLFNYLDKTLNVGQEAFDMKESHSFGKLTINEWNTMMYKHIDHHLSQFGV